MTFWISNYKNYHNIPNNYLCVSISKNVPYFFNKRNAIIPYDGIFNIPNILIIDDFENAYYNYINNKIISMGYKNFPMYLAKVKEMYENNIFHDDNDNSIKYSNIVFMFDDEEDNKHIPLIIKLFDNFGYKINNYKSNNDLSLF
jgi:hypothetical protein